MKKKYLPKFLKTALYMKDREWIKVNEAFSSSVSGATSLMWEMANKYEKHFKGRLLLFLPLNTHTRNPRSNLYASYSIYSTALQDFL